jgi:hypothetical protein
MIDSTPSSGKAFDANGLPHKIAGSTPKSPASRGVRFLSDAAGQFQDALASQPEIRPEMVEKGRVLAEDPDYPSAAVIKHVAGLIFNSPDLSEDRG